ncbi:hypothetical protein [Caballeronia sp. BR00000012568055]|uniref:hypothetical protein n=1 Tax=Caballeronia sp. BR00000012568055 TaxID=2918761 RepID=UPI0023F9A410|nr:hypothetical protein [Caballeronia sp. BR00000012568055]
MVLSRAGCIPIESFASPVIGKCSADARKSNACGREVERKQGLFPLIFGVLRCLKSAHDHAVMGFIMRKKRLPLPEMNDAFIAAAEALALFCRLRNIDAAELPAQDIDAVLDLAFEEAAQQAAAREEARRLD